MRNRIAALLTVLDAAESLADLDQPGFHLHMLGGLSPPRYSLRITGNWRITFEWDDEDKAAVRVDLEDYH